jgi:transposase
MKSIAYVGMDVHQEDIKVAVFEQSGERAVVETLVSNREHEVRKLMRRLSKRWELRCCYEAGGCGYVLQRWLASMGIACAVIAPSLVPRKPGERVRTDRRDARKLAVLLRAELLTEVHVPSPEQESGRALVRVREMMRREVLRSRHYVLKFLQYRGLAYRDGRNWTKRHWQYLRTVHLEGLDGTTYRELLTLLEFKLEQLKRIEREVEQLSKEEPYREVVARLRCYRGIDTLTAMVVVSELWDVRRFATAEALMSYIGSVPSEDSSGGREHRGPITKTGNAYCRRVLVEAAWQYRYRPRVGPGLRKRQRGQPAETILRSWKAQYRLHEKYWRVSQHSEKPTAAVAVARELAGFIWAEMHGAAQESAPDALSDAA